VDPENRRPETNPRASRSLAPTTGPFAPRALIVGAVAAAAFAACASPTSDELRQPGSGSGADGNGSGGSGAGSGGPWGGSGGSILGNFPDDQPDVGVWVPPTGEPECEDPPPAVAPPPTLVTLDECTGKVDAATQQALAQGGSTAGARVLYPYNGTVFPAGLLPPVIQWEQAGSVSAVRLRIQSTYFDYTGCFGANASNRLSIPESVWSTAAAQSQGGGDPFTVELTTMSGGTVMGPLTQTWTIAQGNLEGVLFYNTYTSPQVGTGAVMRLRLGDAQPQAFLTDVGNPLTGPCWSCHSLSAGGGMLVAQRHDYLWGDYSSASFDLTLNPNPNPPAATTLLGNVAEMGLGAVSPDGTKVLTMGVPSDTSGPGFFPDGPGNVPAMIGPRTSKLLNTATGAEIPMSGWTVQYAKMPSFSPDGTKVVFNWHEDGNGHSLGVADFNLQTNTASNIRRIYHHPTLYPGWPFLTPDNTEVIFVLGDTQDYVSAYPTALSSNPDPNRPLMAASDLYIVDVATGNARPLYRANGYPSAGAPTYLPRPGRDEHLEFFPTVSPVASGGYFWLFFTSRRTYGNTMTHVVDDAITKKIWVSAIAIRPDDTPVVDPSYPAFYLPGQEEAAGNIRAFAALEPCKDDGGPCTSGIDCCGGYCYQGSCGLPPPGPPRCSEPPPPLCSEYGERCNTAADCCDDRARCINGYCAKLEPVR
jgi:hypothetical protein